MSNITKNNMNNNLFWRSVVWHGKEDEKRDSKIYSLDIEITWKPTNNQQQLNVKFWIFLVDCLVVDGLKLTQNTSILNPDKDKS